MTGGAGFVAAQAVRDLFSNEETGCGCAAMIFVLFSPLLLAAYGVVLLIERYQRWKHGKS